MGGKKRKLRRLLAEGWAVAPDTTPGTLWLHRTLPDGTRQLWNPETGSTWHWHPNTEEKP